MADLVNSLPPSDRRLVRAMAAEAGSNPEAMAAEIVRAYLGLVRGAPDAMPNDPLRRMASSALRKSGR
mgnify:CR=1 FL=1